MSRTGWIGLGLLIGVTAVFLIIIWLVRDRLAQKYNQKKSNKSGEVLAETFRKLKSAGHVNFWLTEKERFDRLNNEVEKLSLTEKKEKE